MSRAWRGVLWSQHGEQYLEAAVQRADGQLAAASFVTKLSSLGSRAAKMQSLHVPGETLSVESVSLARRSWIASSAICPKVRYVK